MELRRAALPLTSLWAMGDDVAHRRQGVGAGPRRQQAFINLGIKQLYLHAVTRHPGVRLGRSLIQLHGNVV